MHERRDKDRALPPSRNQGRPPIPLKVGGRTTKLAELSTDRTRQPRGTPSHNLPAPRSSFVGREAEMLEVERELATTRLLTLTGVGGSGKTRLALEVARDLVEAYPDGAWLVALAPLSEGPLVPKVVAEALGVPERPQVPMTDTLADVLGDRQLLLVLDNCEHLLEASARLVDELLDSCPSLRILATSREVLGVEGEMRWLVPPLSVPEPRQGTPSSQELEAYGAVRLFIERARGRDPSFSISPKNAFAVAEICRMLEGIPLALELAAARVGTLSVEQISQRLTDSLNLLTGGGRTRLPRQQTLEGTLDWSFELLSEEEKELFGRLSVFAGGWTIEAAEVVGVGGDIEEREVLDLLSGLVNKSLVVARGNDQRGVRYRMLEPIRQYAREKLKESGEVEEVRRRHATFFLVLAEAAESRLRGPEDVEWLERLEAEHDNMRAALSWTLERGEVELGLRLAGALWRFWEAREHYGEGSRWLEEALTKANGASAAARVKVLEAEGWLVYPSGAVDKAVTAAQEGLKLSKHAGLGGAVEARFLRVLGWMAIIRGEYDRAKGLLEESLILSRKVDDKWGIVDALLWLGNSLDFVDRERAKGLREEGIGLARESGYVFTLGRLLFSQGYMLILEGDYERGAALSEEAVELLREHRYTGKLTYALDNLGWAALYRGDPERARAVYEEGLALCAELDDKIAASNYLDGLACVAGAEGGAERAARLFGAAERLREAVGDEHSPEEAALREPYLAMARSRLDEIAWQAAWEQGRGMSMGQVIEYALSAEEPSATGQSPPSAAKHPAGLTSREVEVLGLVAEGLTNAQIAQRLFLSPRTVHTHLNSIYHKIGVNSRAAATRYALEHHLA
jgi:predicted ATPase/DNA-binding CsgD family transcriptional regulator